MYKLASLLLGSLLLMPLSNALASPDLVKQYNCTACHAETKKKYGPTYQQVALKYAGDAGAAERLAKKIQAGGTGVWGKDIMPAQPRVTDADALALAQYILSVQ